MSSKGINKISKLIEIEEVPRNLIQKLREQQKNGDLCDYELRTEEGLNFKVHKWVLRSVSSFFGILFNNNGFGENNLNFLKVPNVSGKVLDKVIEFIYTGVIELTSDIAKEVMNVTMFFNLNALTDYCIEILLETLNEENCLDLLKFSETCVHYGKKLTEESLKLACKKFNTFVELPDFYELSPITMKILMNQSRSTYNEDDLYSAVVNWIGFDSKNRKNFIDELIDRINFKDLSSDLAKSFLKSLSHKDSFFKSLSNNKPTRRELKRDSESEQKNLYIFTDHILLSYDKSDNEFFEIITTVPEKRDCFGCTTFGKDKVFICGGRVGYSKVATCKYFSMQDNCWTDLPSMKTARLYPKLTAMDDQIYVCGGISGGSLNTVELFDINTSLWSQKCSLENFKSNGIFDSRYSICHLNKCIYFLHPNFVQCLDPKNNKLQSLSNLETNFPFHSVEVYDNFIYAFGWNSIRTFDIRTNKWMKQQVKYIQQYETLPRTCVIGWKDSILSIPKKWLSTSQGTDEFGFPDTLPKVPVPPLDQTLPEYVRVLEPIVTSQQLERTKNIIKQFSSSDGVGSRLQQYLLDKRDVEDNWAYHYWLNDMYMDIRLPLPINSNPGMVLPPTKFTTVHDVARFSARIIDAIMMHKEMLDSGKLEQERATSREKGQPLCMAQYYRVLGSCRRPGVNRDSQYLPEKHEDQHVIVCCRNQMYCVPLKASDRGKLTEDEIASQILFILSDAPCLPAKPPPIGILTAEPRNKWARDREILLMNEQNQRNIELIEQALILLCLDEPLTNVFNAQGYNGAQPTGHISGNRDETNMAHEMIHGGGSDFNTPNRWFDKTMQIIVCNDGTWGLCYEHSPSEGIAVVQLMEKVYQNVIAMSQDETGVPQHHLPPPERLEWHIEQEIQQRISEAAKSVDRMIDDFDYYVYRYKAYGKSFIKSCQVSPDAYIQLALQLAYYKLYGHLVSTYESASTRRFLLGRVDCIRSASTEALEWSKAMCQGEGANVPLESDREDEDSKKDDARKVKFSIYSKDHLRELFRCAVARQTEIMVKNILGNGIDIHLLGLREASREQTGSLHELFTDESYKIANCFLLSTSQVACSTDSFMGYGPVTPRGYGCSYNPHPNEIVFCISAFYTCEDTSTSRFAKSLQDSLDIMKDLLES